MQYTRNDWYVAGLESDIADGQAFSSTILNEAIVLWRADGKLFALEDRCVHRAAALSLGRCEGANLRCMYHGLLFNGHGQVLEIPGQDIIPPNAQVRTYPVVARYGFVWVWMGAAAAADEGLLPPMFEDPEDFSPAFDWLDFDAELQLISDNLLDFSHLPYVHANSFQASEAWANVVTRVTPLERGVRYERWTKNDRSPPVEGVESPDEWMVYDYLLPGVLVMWTGAFPPGTAAASGQKWPDLSLAFDVGQQIQPVTPMTNGKSRYYFSFGKHRQRGPQVPSTEQLMQLFRQAFTEDKKMIEAQQRIVDRDPGRPFMPTVHDRGATLYNRLKGRRMAEEQGAPDDSPELAVAM